MNYSDIHTFLTIASSSSLSKAAELLFVSQPALSHRLSALEEELGTELIKRHKGSRVLELTEAGQRFVPIAQKWEELWLETTKIKLGEPAALLRIGNVDSLNFYFMPQVISSFLTEHKECSLHLDTMRSNLSYNAIENKKIDLGPRRGLHQRADRRPGPSVPHHRAPLCQPHGGDPRAGELYRLPHRRTALYPISIRGNITNKTRIFLHEIFGFYSCPPPLAGFFPSVRLFFCRILFSICIFEFSPSYTLLTYVLL